MATYLYGLILDRNAHLVPAHITGIAGSALRVVPCDGLSALVSSVDSAVGTPSLNDVRAHDHALQAVVHHGSTAAATRFGQTFATDEDARHHVRERGARIEHLLEEFDGCVEMRLLLPPSRSPEAEDVGASIAEVPGTVGEGTAYLQRLRASGAAAVAATSGVGLRAALGSVVRAERIEHLPKGRGLAIAHLVQRMDESAYRDAVTSMPTLAEAKLVGPLALYSFAEPAA